MVMLASENEARPRDELPTRDYDRDDDLIAAVRRDGQTRIRVAPWPDVAVVLGRRRDALAELHPAAIRADGVSVLRRAGGGGAVVLDPGNVVVAAVEALPGSSGALRGLSQWTDRLLAALRALGAKQVARRGTSDLAWGGRKVSGSCVYRTRNLLVYSATVLVDPNLALSERYLAHPPREPDYRAGRPHAAFMGALWPALECHDARAVAARLAAELGATDR